MILHSIDTVRVLLFKTMRVEAQFRKKFVPGLIRLIHPYNCDSDLTILCFGFPLCGPEPAKARGWLESRSSPLPFSTTKYAKMTF